MAHLFNLQLQSLANEAYRSVVYTGNDIQIVLMTLLPGEFIPAEIHEFTTQTFQIFQGEATAFVDGHEFVLSRGDTFIVERGSEHEIRNEGDSLLKFATIYSGELLHGYDDYDEIQPDEE